MADNAQIEKLMNLVYEEVELAIEEGNPPFGALIADNKGNIIVRTHNQAIPNETQKLVLERAKIPGINDHKWACIDLILAHL